MNNIINSTINIEPIYKITIGLQHLQTTSNTYWGFFPNEGIAYLKPWYLAALSLNLITP
jgi:hypothetical protein